MLPARFPIRKWTSAPDETQVPLDRRPYTGGGTLCAMVLLRKAFLMVSKWDIPADQREKHAQPLKVTK